MFHGFTDATFEFFMAIRFNNNRTFFQENHDWYVNAVRKPSLELAADLSGAVYALDPSLETRPEKALCRINRDVHFSRDKSPYRDYVWLAFRQMGENRSLAPQIFFDMSDRGASYGMGVYGENRPLMNGLRRALRLDAEGFLAAAEPALGEFSLVSHSFKRMSVPEELPEAAKAWYPLRSFYIQKEISDFSLLKSPRLADALRAGMARFAPLYRYVRLIEPID